MDILPLISIALEVVIAAIALVAAFRGRLYLGGLAVTFGIYVYYDLARYYAWEISESSLSIVFFIATVAALISIVGIVRDRRAGR